MCPPELSGCDAAIRPWMISIRKSAVGRIESAYLGIQMPEWRWWKFGDRRAGAEFCICAITRFTSPFGGKWVRRAAGLVGRIRPGPPTSPSSAGGYSSSSHQNSTIVTRQSLCRSFAPPFGGKVGPASRQPLPALSPFKILHLPFAFVGVVRGSISSSCRWKENFDNG